MPPFCQMLWLRCALPEAFDTFEETAPASSKTISSASTPEARNVASNTVGRQGPEPAGDGGLPQDPAASFADFYSLAGVLL